MADYASVVRREIGEKGDFPACFAFAMLKSGSTLMYKMINAVCTRLSIPAANLPGIFFHEGLPFSAWDNDGTLLECFDDGRIYYGFRALPAFFKSPTIMHERQSVLLVRDPRDALVSLYYSLGGRHLSHKLPRKNPEAFKSRYERTAHLEMDAYVRSAAKSYRARLDDYLRELDFRRVLLRRYEEIYYDKRRFLADIFEHFAIDVPAQVINQVARQFDVRPVEERVGEHLRKGAPGDHREKLDPETIEYLTDFFRPTCSRLGYDLRA